MFGFQTKSNIQSIAVFDISKMTVHNDNRNFRNLLTKRNLFKIDRKFL